MNTIISPETRRIVMMFAAAQGFTFDLALEYLIHMGMRGHAEEMGGGPIRAVAIKKPVHEIVDKARIIPLRKLRAENLHIVSSKNT